MWSLTLVRKAPYKDIVVECKSEVDAFIIGCKLSDACGSIPEICSSNASVRVPEDSSELPMKYEVAQGRNLRDEWRVEAIDNDGAVHVTRFSGPFAEQRARGYAAWKHGSKHVGHS